MSFFTKTTCKKDFWVDENGVVLHTEGEAKLPFTDWVYRAVYDSDGAGDAAAFAQEYISLYEECGCSSECYSGQGQAASICDDLDAWRAEYEDEEQYAMTQAEDVVGVERRKGKCTESFDAVKIMLVAAVAFGGFYLLSKRK